MKIEIKPSLARGKVTPPSSKSYAHRMVIGALLADGESVIRNVSLCEDILATLDCAAALGVKYSVDKQTVRVCGIAGETAERATLPCRDSGSTLRFFIPVALSKNGSYTFRGSERLLERGISVYEDAFSDIGVTFEKNLDNVRVTGELKAGDYVLPGNVSSQYVTGLLYALPLLDGDSTVTVLPPVESRKYIDITIDVLSSFGVAVDEKKPNCFTVKGRQRYIPYDCTVEGDWSNAAFLIALNLLGGEVETIGLNHESVQGDRVFVELVSKLDEPNPVIDISDCPDLGPILFVCAAYKHGATFTGTRRLRIKESDRAAVMARELAKFGVRLTVEENSVTVHEGTPVRPTETLLGHNDHRIVMALAVLSTAVGGVIDGCEAVSKSYPDFFETIASLGVEVIYESRQ